MHQTKTCWVTKSLKIIVATSLDDDTPLELDIANTIVPDMRLNFKKVMLDGVYWLPSNFNSNTDEFRKYDLAPLFVQAARQEGFGLHMKGWERNRNYVRFNCTRGRFYQDTKYRDSLIEGAKNNSGCLEGDEHDDDWSECSLFNEFMSQHESFMNESEDDNPDSQQSQGQNYSLTQTIYEREFTTQRPLKAKEDSRCPFIFRVFWSEAHKRWFLPKKQSGNLEHNGHVQRDPNDIRLYGHHIGRNAVELAREGLSEHILASQMRSLLHRRTGVDLDERQLRHINKKSLRESLVLNADSVWTQHGVQTNVATAADRMIAHLNQDMSYGFVVIFAEYNSDKLTIRAKRRSNLAVTDETLGNLADEQESAESFATTIRDALSITGDGRILLAIAWTKDVARKKFAMYPEITISDVTYSTNSEKRPLLLSCGKDSNGHAFTHTWAFLPSESRWVFDWFFGTAMPALHSRDVLAKTELHVTDEDRQEYSAYLSHCGPGKIYEKARLRLCVFHKLNRNLVTHKDWVSSIASLKENNISGGIEFDMIVGWLHAFCSEYETKEESEFSQLLLQQYFEEDDDLHSGSMGDEFKQKLRDWIKACFDSQKDILFNYNYIKAFTLLIKTSGIVEGENKSIKRSSGGARPKDALDVSFGRMSSLHDKRERKKSRENAHSLMQQVTVCDSSDLSGTETQNQLNKWAFIQLWKEYEAACEYCLYCIDNRHFFVKYRYKESSKDVSPEKTNDLPRIRLMARRRWYHPRFERTRLVKFHHTEEKGIFTITCTCYFYKKMGMCCRHIYRVICREPAPTDVAIRHHRIFEFYYGRDKMITDLLNQAREDWKGIFFRESELPNYVDANQGPNSKPISFFLSSWKKIKLAGPSYWTNKLGIDNMGNYLLKPRKDFSDGSGYRLTDVAFTMEVKMSQGMKEDDADYLSTDVRQWHNKDDGSEASRFSHPEALFGENVVNDVAAIRMEDNSFCDYDEGFSAPLSDNYDYDEPETNFRETTAYNQLHSLYKQVTNMIRDEEELKILNDALHHAKLEIQKIQYSQGVAGLNEGGFISLPEIDRRKQAQRQCPIGSPTMAKKRKKKKRRRSSSK